MREVREVRDVRELRESRECKGPEGRKKSVPPDPAPHRDRRADVRLEGSARLASVEDAPNSDLRRKNISPFLLLVYDAA